MKKKLFPTLTGVFIFVCSLLAFSSCGQKGGDNTNNASAAKLTYDKKYIYCNQANSENPSYYIFHSDKTGEYYCSLPDRWEYPYNYTISFKYEQIYDDAIVCLHDSTVFEEETTEKGDTRWYRLFTCFSENFLCTNDDTVYICETYLPQIPNYNK